MRRRGTDRSTSAGQPGPARWTTTVVAIVAVVAASWAAPVAAQDHGAGSALPGSIGPAPTHAYVAHVHELFLQRSPTAAEAAELAHVVHAHGRGALTSRLALSSEWAGVRVADLYRRVLGRDPEPGGQRHWLAQLSGGRTLESVAAAFYGSDEYFSRVGRDPGRFVDSLYQDLLERNPDPAGRRHWVARVGQGAPRASVAAGFYGAVESRRQRVDALYAEILRRAPDAAGRQFWVGELPALGDVALAASLAASAEVHEHVTGTPPPTTGVHPVGAGTSHPLASSWRPGCPVGPDDLRAVTFTHWRPDGSLGRGVLIVHRDVVDQVRVLVDAAYGSRFPIAQARPVDDFGGDDADSMAANNSSAFNCRTVAGTSTWSQHAFGTAIDLNPVENPYVRGSRVDPPAGRAYADRRDVRPGMLVEGGGVVDALDRLGWGWGGRWSSAADHQHVSRSGR